MLSSGIVILLELFSQRSSHILHSLQISIRIIKLRCISAPKSWLHIKNTVFFTILTFRHIQCLHLMYAEIAWVLASSGTQGQPQVILDPDYLPEYLSVSYDYDQSLSPVLNRFLLSRYHEQLLLLLYKHCIAFF